MRHTYATKIYLLAIGLFTSLCSYSQEINDTFEDGNITGWTEGTVGHWISSTDSPITGSNSLKHNVSSTSGNSYISQSISGLDLATQDVTWQFNIKNGAWDPSSANKFWVYLTANESDLGSATVDGYAIGVNLSGSTDALTLWKVTNGAAETALITTSINWNSSELRGIRVTRSTTGNWEIFADADGGFDNLVSQGTANNTDYTFKDFFGAYFQYTTTRAGFLWLDDILVQGAAPSANPTVTFDSATSNETETDSNFNTTIPVTFSNFAANVTVSVTVNGSSTAEGGDYTLNTNSLNFTSNGTQNISIDINDDADIDNETVVLDIAVTSGTADLSISTHTITIQDDDLPEVRISEFMYNSPSTDDEWIEIFNESGGTLDISNWTLEYNGNTFTFPATTNFSNGSYFTIAVGSNGDGTYNNDNSFTPDFNNLSVANSAVKDTNSTNKLGNTSGTITLKNSSGVTVDVVNYDDGHVSSTDGNGTTYEIVATATDNASTSSNWQASVINGGSPGRISGSTWTGATSNSWTTASNWTVGVPVATSDVSIPSGLTNYPVISANTTINAGVIASGATVIANATVTGNFTYNRSLSTSNWYLVSPPVSGDTFQAVIQRNTFATGTGSNIGIAPYKNDGTAWDYKTNSTTGTITSGQGLSVKLASSGTLSFSGSLQSTNVTYPITQATNNFNLVGNPFAAFINLGTFFAGNNAGQLSEQTIWMWNQATNSYDTKMSGTHAAFEIAPAQAFFVSAGAASTNISFTTANQSHQSDSFQRNARPELTLVATGTKGKSSTQLFFIDGVTTGFDNGYDGSVFGGLKSTFQIATQLVTNNIGKDYAIQSLPLDNLNRQVVPVSLRAKNGELIDLSISSSNLPQGTKVYLENRETKEFVELSENATQIKLTKDHEGIGQFYIHLSSKTLSTAPITKDLHQISIYQSSKNSLTITGLQSNQATMTMYNMLGKKVNTTSFTSNGVRELSIPTLSSAIYMVVLETAEGTVQRKLVIQ